MARELLRPAPVIVYATPVICGCERDSAFVDVNALAVSLVASIVMNWHVGGGGHGSGLGLGPGLGFGGTVAGSSENRASAHISFRVLHPADTAKVLRSQIAARFRRCSRPHAKDRLGVTPV